MEEDGDVTLCAMIIIISNNLIHQKLKCPWILSWTLVFDNKLLDSVLMFSDPETRMMSYCCAEYIPFLVDFSFRQPQNDHGINYTKTQKWWEIPSPAD